jgi:hypothetical protein
MTSIVLIEPSFWNGQLHGVSRFRRKYFRNPSEVIPLPLHSLKLFGLVVCIIE